LYEATPHNILTSSKTHRLFWSCPIPRSLLWGDSFDLLADYLSALCFFPDLPRKCEIIADAVKHAPAIKMAKGIL